MRNSRKGAVKRLLLLLKLSNSPIININIALMIKIMIDMKEFKVIEDRGCDVRYDVITGSYSQCIDWLNYNTVEHPANPDIRISKLEDDVNSNGEPFTYTVEEED